MLTHFMRTYHPNVYLFPMVRACGGARQDMSLEGAPSFYMNYPYYVPFLNERLCISGENILQKNLFILLRSVEVIALLRVLSVLYISVCIPLRWLTGNTENLAQYNFGVLDMGRAVDLLEKAMLQVVDNSELFLDEEFMMSMFSEITDDIDPFQQYMEYMFEEKQSNPVGGSRAADTKTLPFDELRAELFYPTRRANRQTQDTACQLGKVIAATIIVELRDTSKATSHYLSSIKGKFSQAQITEEDRKANMNKMAHNSISESNHASSTAALQICGNIRLDHAAAEGQTRANNDFGRKHESLVKGNRAKSTNAKVLDLGMFHQLPCELQETLIQTSRENAMKTRQSFDNALQKQRVARQEKEELVMKKKLDRAKEDYIVAMYFYEQYHSPRCWTTVEKAMAEYNELESESKKLKAVKEQILIRYIGLGWDKAHHPWSHDKVSFTAHQLFHHLINIVIPLADKLGIPPGPPLTLPSAPTVPTLGTKADIDMTENSSFAEQVSTLKISAIEERADREKKGQGDKYEEWQQYSMPKIDDLVGFKIEMLFKYSDEDGDFNNWCHGEITSIVNAKTNYVQVRWAPEFVEDGRDVTKEKLLKTKWNPSNPVGGAWRQYFAPNEI